MSALAAQTGLGGPGVGLVAQAASGEIVAATAEAEAILGLSLDQMMGRTSQDPRWVAVDRDGISLTGHQHPAMRALATGLPVHDAVMGVHRPVLDAAGRHIWLQATSIPVPMPGDGAPGGVLTAFTELVGPRAHELHVAESERMFRFLSESAADMVAWQLPDTTFLWVSPASGRLLGRTPADLVGRRAYDLMHPDDAEAGLALERATAAGEPPPGHTTLRIRHAAGHLVWVEVTDRVLTGDDGRPTQLLTAWRDVSARVQAEAERDAALRLVRSAVENSPIGIALREVDGTIVQANTALGVMLGRPAAALLGSTLRAFVHPQDLGTGDDVDGAEALLAGDVTVHESERRYLRGDGGTVWGHCTSVLLPDETGSPRHVLIHLQDVTARKDALDELARSALTDPLTGLLNRSVFMDRLAHALEHRHAAGSRVGVLFVDLDHFKLVNDSLGHDVGDEVLRQTARRICGAVRHQDLVARLGGDEFVVLCPDVPEHAESHVVTDIAGRVVGALAVPFRVGAREVHVSASVGVTVADRRGGARDVMVQADAAMYRAKMNGRGRFEVGTEAVETMARGELDLDADLERGIAAGELRLLYQPIVRAPLGDLVAREALVRWQHPTLGLLEPRSFLAAADRGPLAVPLGAWVLERACCEAAGWATEAVVHVNVTALHLAVHDFAGTVARALADSGLPARRLVLEITESLALTASRSTLRSVAALAELGVGLYLDDFGTGLSSISALHRIPVTGLKIDMSFVQDLLTPVTAALVDGLIHLGLGMGLDVVAEGVEDDEQSRWLVEHGCPWQQGHLHGQPTPTGQQQVGDQDDPG